jgi:hypothetical protein
MMAEYNLLIHLPLISLTVGCVTAMIIKKEAILK